MSTTPRCLGVLLCYNDGDILADAITALLNANHHVIAWNHGSTDETESVLNAFRHDLLEAQYIGRDVDFYDMYPLMSKHLLREYVGRYDWISWPDQDELLEGPTRQHAYEHFIREAWESEHNWIQFLNFVFWFTERDDPTIASPASRIKYYSLFRDRVRRIRSWRASATNIRWFNHNETEGTQYPVLFNLRHYPMRTAAQMQRRILVDRSGLKRGPVNAHYESMKERMASIAISPEQLQYDDGCSELSRTPTFDWQTVYGDSHTYSTQEQEAWILATCGPHVSWAVSTALTRYRDRSSLSSDESSRIARWLAGVSEQASDVALLVIGATADKSAVVTTPGSETHDSSAFRHGRARVVLDADDRSVTVHVNAAEPSGQAPLVVMVPVSGFDGASVTPCRESVAQFRELREGRYIVAIEPV
jgi:hypothetical protein